MPDVERLIAALRLVEWGCDRGAGSVMDVSYCRACGGFWGPDRTVELGAYDHPPGEPEYTHAEDCPVAAALAS